MRRETNRLLGGRVTLRQRTAGYRAAVDPVLLAAAVAIKPGERVLDLGCGTGAVALCLLARQPGAVVTGLDIDPDNIAMAAQNARDNNVADRFTPLVGDILAPPAALPGGFDHVVMNPPYLPAARAQPERRDDPHTVETGARLQDWLDFALRRLADRGSLTVIHRADRIDAIVAGLHGRAGGIALYPIWPKAGQAARRVIVRARKGARAPARLGPGLVLHDADGAFGAAAEAVLRNGAALPGL